MLILQKLVSNLSALGTKRLMLLALTGAITFGLLAFSVYSFNRPVRTILYSKLDKSDVNAIGAALSEVGMPFDVNEEGDAVLVEFASTARARMLLAERGLPKSDKSGYELFDQMGSLGLTSFMQHVTKVRALEGELVRTIQQLDGIKAARVHLALKSEGSLRSREGTTTASVVVRTDGKPSETMTSAIRHVVAAAIPGLQVEQVIVTTTDGQVLTTSRQVEDTGAEALLDFEKNFSEETRRRVERTLLPFAGLDNVRVSVSSTVNLDKRQLNETKFDPESKVERSTRSSKSTDNVSDTSSSSSVSVDQNIPQEVKPATPGESSVKKKESKEETVNYELNSLQTATTSSGYVVERISVAVVVNRAALAKTLGTNSDEQQMLARLAEIEDVAKSAAGLVEKRGDVIKVSAIEFFAVELPAAEVDGPGAGELIAGNLGTLINALSLLLGLVLTIMLGLRPALKLLLAPPAETKDSLPAPAELKTEALAPPDFNGGIQFGAGNPGMVMPQDETARNKLNKIVGVDIDRAAQVLKGWLDDREQRAA